MAHRKSEPSNVIQVVQKGGSIPLFHYYRGQKLRPKSMPGGVTFWATRYQEEKLERTGRCELFPPEDPDRGGWNPQELLAAYTFTLADPRFAQARLSDVSGVRPSEISRWKRGKLKRGSVPDQVIRRAINDAIDA